MKSIHLATLGMAALLSAPATMVFAQAESATPAEAPAEAAATMPAVTDPQEFADMAGSSNMFEIQSSELAVDMSQNEDVIAFAEQMIADHGMAAEAMMAAAESDGVTPPEAMNEQHQAKYDELAGMDAASFDQAYIDAQVMAHEEAVALFQGFSTEGEESALKGFAAETLPTLEMHLEHIQSMSGM